MHAAGEAYVRFDAPPVLPRAAVACDGVASPPRLRLPAGCRACLTEGQAEERPDAIRPRPGPGNNEFARNPL